MSTRFEIDGVAFPVSRETLASGPEALEQFFFHCQQQAQALAEPAQEPAQLPTQE